MIDDIQSRVEAEIGASFIDKPKMYIGDAVYAFYDGYAIILATDRGISTHWIALEPAMIDCLVGFYKELQNK